ncbi:MAG: DEAD/DEAH box helicase, partial [Candidatus Tectomicrobia bacterium]|nr:DEAD/DEAH box helicase [Candidatus Tectomicrobia bacterium]
MPGRITARSCMDVFNLRSRLVADYQSYTRSFIKIRDARIAEHVDNALNAGVFWPEPLLQLNPTFLPGGTIDNLVEQGVLHPECARIFRIDKSDTDHSGKRLLLHEHQRAAIVKAKKGKSYVITSGTGSGKSLAYIVPIVDHVLRNGSGRGIQAIVVYPMNALANSQDEELKKFLEKGYPEGRSPVRFARYTGQEKGDAREAIRGNPPDVFLTNYMMLELLLTRAEDRELVRAAQGLQFLVFDELHTYRGRQGADVALLIRRCRQAFGGHDIVCIGTSATMASGGSTEDQRREVVRVAQSLFGVDFSPEQVIGEALERATPEVDLADSRVVETIRASITSDAAPPADYDTFRLHLLASWIESTFGVRKEAGSGQLIRQAPRRLQGDEIENQKSAASELAERTGADPERCAAVLHRFLLHGAGLRRSESSRFPIFAFRLHQFFTRGDTVWATIEPGAARHLEIAKKAARPGEPEKPLFPLVFCRHCGTAYYRVKVASEDHGRTLFPREDRREDDDDGSGDAYLYVSEEAPWPRADGPALFDRLPDFMKETTTQGVERVRPDSRADLPEPVFVDVAGRIV